jgi:hypothetical protein
MSGCGVTAHRMVATRCALPTRSEFRTGLTNSSTSTGRRVCSDDDVDDRRAVAALMEARPAAEPASVVGLAAGPGCGSGELSPVAHRSPGLHQIATASQARVRKPHLLDARHRLP